MHLCGGTAGEHEGGRISTFQGTDFPNVPLSKLDTWGAYSKDITMLIIYPEEEMGILLCTDSSYLSVVRSILPYELKKATDRMIAGVSMC